MSRPTYMPRSVVPRAEYWGEVGGQDAGYVVMATSDAEPLEVEAEVSGVIPAFVGELDFVKGIDRIRSTRGVEPTLAWDDLRDLIFSGESNDLDVPTSGHFYAASIQLLEVGSNGKAVVKSREDYQLHAYLRLGDTTGSFGNPPEEFDIAEIAVDQQAPFLNEGACRPLLGALLRTALKDLGDKPTVKIYADIPTELGRTTLESFGIEPLQLYGFEGNTAVLRENLSFLGPDHLTDY